MSAKGLWSAAARINDAAAMAVLLDPLPPKIREAAEQLAHLPDQHGMRHDEETRRAYWLQNSEGVLLCITFDGVKDLNTAAELWAAIDQLPHPIDMDTVAALYGTTLGETIELIGERH